jgi:23S rRNA (cytidine1920-2'-O)/16S rRNA (cytidine1409-2'-O)-methyltransferase
MEKEGKKRLDQILVERGLFPSRTRAQAAIMEGKIGISGASNLKSGDRFREDVEIEVLEADMPYVSRGGLKLEGALDYFKISPSGWEALDVGASTGGFTDCLLKRGAKSVTALDVGRGLIAWSLRNDPRVIVLENINARNLTEDQAPGPFDLIVIDVSFISLKLIFPNLPARLKSGGLLLALIKPQFEAGKGKAPKGVVKDPEVWSDVLKSFESADIFGQPVGMGFVGFTESAIEGREGNKEFFGLWKKQHP